MPDSPAGIRNILVVRNDRFGEFLLNIPAFRALKETFPAAKIIAVVDPALRILVQRVPFIDEIIEWSREKHSFLSKVKLIMALRKKRIDLAVMLNPSREFNFITWFCRIPLRVGYDRKWGFLLNRRKADTKYLEEMHEVEYNLGLVGLVGAKTNDTSLSLNIPDDRNSAGIKEVLVAIHPWTSDPVKQWPYDYFVELAARLAEELNVSVFIIGGKSELVKSKQLFGAIESGKLVNLTGKTNLLELAALLRKCNLLVSGDSGPVHLAACVGLPCLAIFRNDLPGKGPKRWGPWGKGSIVVSNSSLKDISVDQVFKKAKEKLGI